MLAFCACVATPEPAATPQARSTTPTAVSEAIETPTEYSVASSESATAPAPLPVNSAPAPIFASSGHPELDAWRDDFALRAVSSGRDPSTVKLLLDGVKPLKVYLPAPGQSDKNLTAAENQAEFAKPIWEYVASAVNDTRKTKGRRFYSEMDTLFEELELNFAVDREAILAIWAMETNFGGYIGDFDGPETLANMATEGRRRGLAERELFAMMTILERGEARRQDLISGWAGAMGQTQFMPSVFLTRAVDWDGDGKKDLWKSKADALASAANYLALAGYSKGQPWGVEVTVSDGFDYSIADGRHLRGNDWLELGVMPAQGRQIPLESGARLWLPAGANGPKYLIYSNFDVFLNYNRANAYAFSVGLLSDAFAGIPGVQASWPKSDGRLNRDEIKQMQAALNAKGYPAGVVDGIAGTGTRKALQSFQKDNGLIADGYPTRAILPYVLQGQ